MPGQYKSSCPLLATFIFLTVVSATELPDCSQTLTLNSWLNPSAISNCSVQLEPFTETSTTHDNLIHAVQRFLGLDSSLATLSDITVRLPLCATLWNLTAQECTFYLSSTWPSLGLEAGPAYLFYQRLVGVNYRAERVNVTCPTPDWTQLLAPNSQANLGSSTASSPLAPCGTATVSTGQQLVDALGQLQRTHARVLITLAANISLPAAPTPQRLDPAPDDSQPLVRVYRNVTLAGGTPVLSGATTSGSSTSGVELDMRMRRNAFDLQSTGQQMEQVQQQQDPGGQAAGGAGSHPVLVFANIHVVNIPPGPPSTWPVGLLSTFCYFLGLNRSGRAGVQFITVRTELVRTPGELGYFGYWFGRMVSLNPEERASGAWLQRIVAPPVSVTDADGRQTTRGAVMDYTAPYNFTSTTSLFRTPPTPADFNMWSLEPPAPPAAPPPPLPPASFAVAMNTSQLLGLLQETWMGGLRAILVVNNITLHPDQWPQGGAALSYSAALVGPIAGPPVWLDTGGLQLVTTSSTAGGNRSNGTVASSVTLQLHRLNLTNSSTRLFAVNPGDLPAAAAMGGSAGLGSWSNRCSTAAASGTATPVRFELCNCTLQMPEVMVNALGLFNSAGVCNGKEPGGTAAGAAAADGDEAAAAAAKVVCGSARLPDPLRRLMNTSLSMAGQVAFVPPNSSSKSYLSLKNAVYGNVTFLNTTAVSAGGSSGARETAAASAANASDTSACDLKSLVAALAALPLGPAAEVQSEEASRAPVVGGAVGGAVGVAVLAAAIVALFVRQRRKRRRNELDPKPDPGPGQLPEVLIAGSPPGSGGGSSGGAGRHRVLRPLPGAGAADMAPAYPVDADEDRGRWDSRFTLSSSEQEGMGGPSSTMMQMAQMLGGGAGGQGGPAGVVVAGRQRSSDAAKPDLRATIQDDIQRMMRQCQAAVEDAGHPASGGGGRGRTRRMPLLGRGAYGVVFLGEWRGLPAAIKVLTLGPADLGPRQERLAREVALTMALSHPHVVPTYHYALDALRVGGQPEAGGDGAGSGAAGGAGGGGDADCDIAALHLRVVMQYCEGGTLGGSLRQGRFGVPVLGPEPSPPQSGAAPPLTPQPPAATPLSVSAQAWESPAAAAAGLAATAAVGPAAPAPEGLPVSGASEAAGAAQTGASRQPLSWTELKPAANLPLALLAALDVARGLEYLHGCNVIHGDLTENNVLLKAVQPLMPPPLPPAGLPPLQPPLADSPAGLEGGLRQGAAAWVCGAAEVSPQGVLMIGSAPTSVAAVEGGLRGSSGAGGSAVGAAGDPATPGEVPAGAVASSERSPYAGDPQRLLRNMEPSSTTPHSNMQQQQREDTGAGLLVSPVRQLTPTRGSQGTPAGTGRSDDVGSDTGSAAVVSPATTATPSQSDRRSWLRDMRSRSTVSYSAGTARTSSSTGADVGVLRTARQLLRWVFKISDFGLAVQVQDPTQSHLSNMWQGTPFFAAPEVVQLGRLSPAADVYSYGVLLWLLLHGIAMGQIRHLLPGTRSPVPIGPLLRRHTAPDLPPAARALLQRCLAVQPAQRPQAPEIRAAVEGLLKAVAGPELSHLLLTAERREHLLPENT